MPHEPPRLRQAARHGRRPAPIGTRPVLDAKSGKAIEVPMYDRLAMAPGARVEGPALIVEAGTSTLVSAAFDAEIDAGLGLVLVRKTARPRARRHRTRLESDPIAGKRPS